MGGSAEFLKLPGVRFERLLAAPVGQVWEALTLPERAPGWYGDAVIEPPEGGRISLMGGHIRGVVSRCMPLRTLAYSWNVFAPGEAESPYPESYLTLELEPHGDGARLVLTHAPVLERFERQNAMGWHTFLDLVEAAALGQPQEAREVYMRRNAEIYGVDLGALAR